MELITRVLEEAHSYATFKNANNEAKKEIARYQETYKNLATEEHMLAVNYCVLAQEDGRFTPCVIYGDNSEQFAFFVHETNVSVCR